MKFLLLILSLSINLAQAGERVGNGEGLGEQRVNSINEYLPFYMGVCLKGGCRMSTAELNEAQTILESREAKPKFSYVSGKKNPGMFGTAGVSALIRTTQEASSPVTINLDSLYKNQQALTIEEALGVVVSVYNVKAGAMSSALFLAKLGFALTQNISFTQHSFDYSYLKLTLFKSANLFEQALFVSDNETSVNITANLAEHFKCPTSKRVSITAAAWFQSTQRFSLLVEGVYECGIQRPFRVSVDLNLKSVGSGIPGTMPRVKVVEVGAIQKITDLP